MRLTYAGLTFSIPIKGLIQIESFAVRTAFSDHARVTIKIMMDEKDIENSINLVGDGAQIKIWEKEDKQFFCGRILSVDLLRDSALNYLTIEAVSYTYDWELQEVSQSFLDLDATYEDVFKKVLDNYDKASVKDCITKKAKIPDFLLQYEESDWTFLQRLASHFGTFLVPDITQSYGRVYFGIPEIKNGVELARHQYSVDKNMEKYYQFSGDKKFVAQETLRWYVTTKKHFVLGEELKINDIKAIVTRVDYIGSGGVITKRYEISRKKGVRCIYQKNPRIFGMSIPATVKERNGNCVRVHFDIDQTYEKKPKTKFFTYALETSSMYCMPEEGSKVHVYFPSHFEQEAIAVHAIRTPNSSGSSGGGSGGASAASGGGGGGYAQDPDQKSFSNSNGAEMLLTPANISFAADAGKETMAQLTSEGDIILMGKTISIISEESITLGDGEAGTSDAIIIKAVDSIDIGLGEDGENSIHLDAEAQIVSAFVKMKATTNPPVEKPTAKEIAAMTAGDQEARDEVNAAATQKLVTKTKEAKSKIFNGVVKALVTIGTVIVVCVATGGLAIPVILAGAVVTAFAVSDVAEGIHSFNQATSGDLSKSYNFLRDFVFQGNEALYEFAKFAADVVFGLVTGKALGALSKANKVVKLCSMAKSAGVHMATNMVTGAIRDLVVDGKVNWKGLAINAGIGLLQGILGNKLGAALGGAFGGGFLANVVGKTVIDVALDAIVSGITGQPFNLKESIAKNLFSNVLSEAVADPIDIVTGAYIISTVDVLYPSLVKSIELKRTYQSVVKKVGSMGRGWQFKYDSRLFVDNGDIHLDTVTGHNVLFRKVDGVWENLSKGCNQFVLSENQSEQTLLLHDLKEHTTYVYNHDGYLMEIVDQNEQVTKLYYQDGMLSSLITPLGLELSFTCKDGKIIKISDPIGRKLEYCYKGDLLVDVIHMDQGGCHYEYDECGYLRTATDQNGITYLVNKYDRDGRSIKQTLSNGAYYEMEYDIQNNRSRAYYADMDRTEWFYYNHDLQVTRIKYDDNTQVQYEYNDNHGRIKVTDRKGNVTERDYDKCGNLIYEKSADGREVISTYNDQGDLITVTDNSGSETHYEYDGYHNQIRERRRITEDKWQTRTYTYDNKGRLIQKTNANDHAIRYEYDHHTVAPVAFINGEQEETTYEYDAIGRCMTIENDYGRVEFGYNTRNFVTSRIDGEGNASQSMYDKMGNLIAYYPPKAWAAKGESYQYRYNDMEELIEVITPLNEHYLRHCNPEGDVIKKIHPNDYRMGEEDGVGVVYDYDKENHRIRVHYPEGGTERFFYDNLGNVVKHISPEYYDEVTDDGNGYYYSYDASSRLTQVINPDGDIEHLYQYDWRGNLIQEKDGVGHEVLYQYNLIGRLVEKRESIDRDSDTVSYRVTLYDYDLEGNKIQEKYGKNAVLREEYPTSYQYITFEYDANEHLTLVKDDFGAMMRYRYDCLGNRTFEERIISEGVYQRIYYQYNKAGLLIQKKEAIMGNETCKWAVTKYAYDPNGNLIKETTPNGYVIKKEYDECDRLISIRTIDKKNKIDRLVVYAYDKASNLISVEESAPGQEVSCYEYTYDWQDRLTHWKNPLGGTKRYLYDKNSRVLKAIDAENYQKEGDRAPGTTYTYDIRGNALEVMNGFGIVTEQNAYNVMNCLTMRTDGVGNILATEYTNDLQVKSISNTGNNNTNQVLQTYQYNARGQVIGVVDGNENPTHYQVDDWGRITKTIAADGSEEAYAYNEGGQITTTIDANGNVITYKYNSFGKVSEIVDQEGQSDYFYYDAEQNQVRNIDRNGNRVEREFNVDGNLVKQIASNVTGEETVVTIYAYDGRGHLNKAIANGFSYQYQYTKDGQLLEKSTCGKTLLRYTYNQSGQMTSVTDISGKTSCYEYDMVGRLQMVTDERKELVACYRYTNNDLLKEVVHGNGIHTCYEYDRDGNVIRLVTKTNDVTLLDLAYTYDGNGNRLEKQGRAPAINGTGQRDVAVTYQYNINNQLLQEVHSGQSTQYEYDKVGNRISKTDFKGIEQYQYSQKNQLISHQGIHGNTTFTYDRQGSMIREEGSDGVAYYEYNPLNQQTKVVKPNQDVQVNRYDPEGLRAEIQENERLVKFLFHHGEILVEMDGEDNLTSRFVRGYGVEASEQNNTVYYYHKDEQLSTSFISDEQSSIQNVYNYDAFGVVKESRENIDNRITYTGQQYDGITGQYYLRARYYNPVLGRFMQEDVYRGDGLNLYAYCDNNPVTYYDPSGYYVDPSELPNTTSTQKRNSPGTATGTFSSGNKEVGTTIISSDKTTITIPQSVAQKMTGKEYNDFGEFREDLWKNMAASEYKTEFDSSDLWAMEHGYAPRVHDKDLKSSQFGKKYNLDHVKEIQDGGNVYDLDNISIVAPKTHEEKTKAEREKRKNCKKG